MPFKEISIKAEIKKQRENSPEFRKTWDELHIDSETTSENIISPKGSSWDDLEKQLFTSREILESEVRVTIINEMINAREENEITQKQLEAMSGIKQPVISRMEQGITVPQLSTVLKILNSLGKTLKIVPMK